MKDEKIAPRLRIKAKYIIINANFIPQVTFHLRFNTLKKQISRDLFSREIIFTHTFFESCIFYIFLLLEK